MKNITIILFLTLIFTSSYADDISKVAKKLNLYAGTKASIQWERIFSSPRRMKQYELESLPFEIKNRLKIYLIEHAADSEQPIVPGL